MATAGNIIGKVAVLQGQAFARAKDGTQRKLKVGDAVFENEVIVTAENSRVELEFDNGKIFLLRAKETVTLDSAVIGSELPDNRNAALLDRVGELADITRAIAEGSSLDQLLEETAAGLTGGGNNDGGHNFVQLLRIAEALDPAGHNYRFNAGNLGFELPPGGSVPDGVPIPVPAPPAPGGNLSPTAAAVFVLGAEDAASIPVSLSAADADGTIVSYTIVSLPANGTLYADAAHTIVVTAGDTVVSAALFFVPNPNWNGTTNFNFTATDNIGAVSSTATVTLNVGAVDDLPLAVADTVAVSEDTPLTASLATNDTPSGDGGNLWAKATDPANGTVTVTAAGVFTYTPNANFNGVDSFTYTLTDADGDVSTATVTLNVGAVDDLPLAVADTVAVSEDTPLTASLATNDTPSGDGGNLWAKATDPANGTVTVTAAGVFTYTPNANFNGVDSFTYTLTDADGDVSTATVTLNVGAVDDLPLAVADTVAVSEDTPLTASLATNDTPSGDGGNLWAKASDPANGSVTVTAAGVFTYTPNANFNGVDSFTYSLTDADGDVSTATVTLNVGAVDDLPLAVADTVAVSEDTPLTASLATNDTPSGDGGNLWAKATDPANGTVTVTAAGVFTYTPNANFNGVNSFTYSLTDADGDVSTATVTLNVGSVDDASVMANDTNTVVEDTTLTVVAGAGVLSNDSDIDNTLSVTSFQVAGDLTVYAAGSPAVIAGVGTLTINANGSYTFSPAANYSGAVPVATYTVNTGSTATLTLAVTPVNDAPVANNSTASGNEDVLIPITLTGTDIDGTVASFTLSSLPANGRLYLDAAMTLMAPTGTALAASGNALTLYFQPLGNWFGSASFNYTATDNSGGGSNTATATINVAAVDDGTPVAVADSYQTNTGTSIIISKASLLANDSLPDNATFQSFTPPTGGTLVDNGDGTLTYTAPAGVGAQTFTYTVQDDMGQTSAATVTISVYQARDDLATVHESALPDGNGGGVAVVTGNLFANDGAGNASISRLNFNGGAWVTDGGAGDTDARAGYIGMNTTDGNVVVDITGAGAGDYTYTLGSTADNSGAGNNTSVTEVINYDANVSDAALRVTIMDDVPTAVNMNVEVPEGVLPKFSIVLTIDTSGSMSDEVRSIAEDGTVTMTTRMDMAKLALKGLVEEYFTQTVDVQVKIVEFDNVANILNGNNWYTSKEAVFTAIDSLTASGGTNYEDALNDTMTAIGAPDATRQNIVYFMSDGNPTSGNTANPVGVTGYDAFVNANNIKSYGVGIGTGITNTTHLNGVHNVDTDGDGLENNAILIPDLNKLESELLSTVPASFGGNVVAGNGTQSVTFGADGGYIQSISIMLDSNADTTPDQLVTFTYNSTLDQITHNGGAYAGSSPLSGSNLTLNASRGFAYGTLIFNFSSGDYTYYTSGIAPEGTTFNLGFVARDADGDTASASQTITVVDGKPVAHPDTDTLIALNTFLEGNVVTGIGTDGGVQLGAQLTAFAPQGGGVDEIMDGAQVTSIVFKGLTYNLGTPGSGNASGGTYTISGGRLTWSHASNGSQLIFEQDGYYKFTPPTADIPTTPAGAPVVQPTLMVSDANVSETGGFAQFTVSLSSPSAYATTVSLATATGGATGTGSATSGTDFGATATVQVSTDGGASWTTTSTATIAAGLTSVLVRVPIMDNDTATEPLQENFRLTATRTAGWTANTAATGYGVINEDDLPSATNPAVVSIDDVVVNEAAGTATFTISVDHLPIGGNLQVNYQTSAGSATAGSDYTTTSGSVTFNTTGALTRTLTVPIGNDALFEGSESFFVDLISTNNADRGIIGDGRGIATILDNDPSALISVALTADPAGSGITLQGMARNSSVPGSAAVNYSGTNGAGVVGNDGNELDDLETLLIDFNRVNYPQGVENLSFNIYANDPTYNGTSPVTFTFYDIDGNELGQYAVSVGDGATTWFTMPAQFSGVGRVTALVGDENYYTDPVVRIRDVRFDLCALDLAEPVIPAEVIQYTLTDSDGDTSTSTLTLNVITNHLAGTDAANDTIAGTGANDAIAGLAGNDVLSGLAGNDLITGGDGSDTIDGGADDDTLAGGEGNDAITGGSGKDTLRGDAGNDTLDGGTGDDTLDGGAGNDVIIGGDGIDSILGGAGSDTLTGGIGADVFKWELADRGTKGTPAVDTITDFDPALPGAGGDVLDLRDLLAGESHPTGTGNLASFLHFETAGSDTKVHISSTGGFLAGYAPGQEDQTILLQNVDLIGSFSTDQQIIQDLLNKGKLITD